MNVVKPSRHRAGCRDDEGVAIPGREGTLGGVENVGRDELGLVEDIEQLLGMCSLDQLGCIAGRGEGLARAQLQAERLQFLPGIEGPALQGFPL